MIFLIVRRFTRVSIQKPTGSERETRIPNFFMQGPLKDGNIIQFWEFGTMLVTGLGIKTVLPELLFPILRNYTPPPIRVRQRV